MIIKILPIRIGSLLTYHLRVYTYVMTYACIK